MDRVEGSGVRACGTTEVFERTRKARLLQHRCRTPGDEVQNAALVAVSAFVGGVRFCGSVQVAAFHPPGCAVDRAVGSHDLDLRFGSPCDGDGGDEGDQEGACCWGTWSVSVPCQCDGDGDGDGNQRPCGALDFVLGCDRDGDCAPQLASFSLP